MMEHALSGLSTMYLSVYNCYMVLNHVMMIYIAWKGDEERVFLFWLRFFTLIAAVEILHGALGMVGLILKNED